VRREWEPEDLVACWTLVEADRELIVNKTGATRLGFALQQCGLRLLGFCPADVTTAPAGAVAFVARQLGVDPGVLEGYGAAPRRARTTSTR
jgi:hypothetical protein